MRFFSFLGQQSDAVVSFSWMHQCDSMCRAWGSSSAVHMWARLLVSFFVVVMPCCVYSCHRVASILSPLCRQLCLFWHVFTCVLKPLFLFLCFYVILTGRFSCSLDLFVCSFECSEPMHDPVLCKVRCCSTAGSCMLVWHCTATEKSYSKEFQGPVWSIEGPVDRSLLVLAWYWHFLAKRFHVLHGLLHSGLEVLDTESGELIVWHVLYNM